MFVEWDGNWKFVIGWFDYFRIVNNNNINYIVFREKFKDICYMLTIMWGCDLI